ncbi:MAG TPA: sigma-70 family RNA polymerase sigma factor [Baekduia sp.]|uniref:sigma-70 family RNA polymerase sigma factor n=1 Tax=Baekduia sp. TaxID=2600305 RepID=UPI002D788C7B|nr:sigma-70 family RNA polymerase sigma factor [Baekduia sp.]HET6506142.1 sigma-70 family RNA polymerase sigma factor [Baekduia sp.]
MKPAPLRHPARLAGASLLRLQSDARLAELAVAGHEAAFDAIVDRYRTPLMRYCAGIVGPSRAEDAVQQALINAHEAMTRTDEVRHLKPWLYRIAHNASLNVLRAVRDDVPLDEAALGARASGAGPEESFERSEQFRSTLAALQALPERQRAALVLRELEGRSHEEIAEALGVTKGSARQHLMRARVAVRSAATAITPYPLVARFAELLSGGRAPGWVDAAAGAGASATLMKLGAGVAATGALVGGAVGTHHAMRGGAADAAAVPRTVVQQRAGAPAAVERAGTPPVTAAVVGNATPAVARDDLVARRPGSGPGPGRRGKHGKGRGARNRTVGAGAGAPDAAVPTTTVESGTSHRGRQNANGRGNAQGNDDAQGRQGRGRGSADHPNNASKGNGRSGTDDTQGNETSQHSSGRGDGNGNGKGSGTGTSKSGASGSSSGRSGNGEDQGQDTSKTPSAPAAENIRSGSNGSGKGDSNAQGTSSSTPTPTSTTPASSAHGDEGD